MVSVFLCYAEKDRALAQAIARRLEQGAEARVVCDELPAGQTVNAAWEAGLGADAVLVVLSESSVPPKVKREDWAGVLEHLEGNAEPPVGWVLAGQCPFPPLLRRNTRLFFDGADLRGMERWALSLRETDRGFVPARLSWFSGRGAELERLWQWLVDETGTVVVSGGPGSGKSCLAQEFARAAGEHFHEIVWLGCGERSETFLHGELARCNHWERRRRLLVLEDAGVPFLEIPPAKRASVLITTRDWWTERAVLLGEGREAAVNAPEEEELLRLWEAMTVCRRDAFPLALAAEIAGLSSRAAQEVADRLAAGRWIDPLDAAGKYFRRPEGGEAQWLRRRHAEVLDSAFGDHRQQPDQCKAWLAEWESAWRWAMQADWRLAASLGLRGFRFLKETDWLYEAVEVVEDLLQAAELRGDTQLEEECRYELSWIHGAQGNLRRPAGGGEQLGFDFR
ncbi:MAG: TIR domain-containing protein [Bryobacterales bacterium]|nr:TIR domain-containing protein [Bryobacterales bacterium]